MNSFLKSLFVFFVPISCKEKHTFEAVIQERYAEDVVIAFGSCHQQCVENKLWNHVLENNPSV